MKKFLFYGNGTKVNNKYDVFTQASSYIFKSREINKDISSFVMIQSDYDKFIKEEKDFISSNFKVTGNGKINLIFQRPVELVTNWRDLLNIPELNLQEEILFTMFELEGYNNPVDFFGVDFRYNDESKFQTFEDAHEIYAKKYFTEYIEDKFNNFKGIHLYLKTMGVLIGTNGMRRILDKTISDLYFGVNFEEGISLDTTSDLLFLKFLLTNRFQSVIMDVLIKNTIFYLNEKQPKLIHGYINRISKILNYLEEE